jgi:hypothetical protein
MTELEMLKAVEGNVCAIGALYVLFPLNMGYRSSVQRQNAQDFTATCN